MTVATASAAPHAHEPNANGQPTTAPENWLTTNYAKAAAGHPAQVAFADHVRKVAHAEQEVAAAELPVARSRARMQAAEQAVATAQAALAEITSAERADLVQAASDDDAKITDRGRARSAAERHLSEANWSASIGRQALTDVTAHLDAAVVALRALQGLTPVHVAAILAEDFAGQLAAREEALTNFRRADLACSTLAAAISERAGELRDAGGLTETVMQIFRIGETVSTAYGASPRLDPPTHFDVFRSRRAWVTFILQLEASRMAPDLNARQ